MLISDFLGWSGIGDVSYYTLTGDPGWSGSYYVDESGNIVEPQELIPNPDFFTSVLWKNIMGTVVLDLQYGPFSNPMVKGISLHAHCATALAAGVPGAISLAFANTNTEDINIDDMIAKNLGSAGCSPRIEYFLTSGDDTDLASRSVRLNGADEVLNAASDLTGRLVTSGPLILPSFSYGFIVFPEAGAKACTTP